MTALQNVTVTGWRSSVIEAWEAGKPIDDPIVQAQARLRGIPDRRPLDPFTAAKLLWGAGFTPEATAKAVGLEPEEVVRITSRLSPALPKAIELHALGLSVYEAAERTGVKRPTLDYHLRQRGIQRRRKRRFLTDSERASVLAAYRTGEPVQAIARRLGLNYDTVRKFLARVRP